jgi:hypothetical protein
LSHWGPYDTTFRTYVLTPLARSLPPPPATITPCVHRLCPATIGGFAPAGSTDGVMSYFLFAELANGTVQGTLSFIDSSPDGIAFSGCTTGWGGCRLTVKTFACTDRHAMTVAGSYTQRGQTGAASFKLTLSGVWNGPGTYTLTSAGYTYTLFRDGLVHVTCPPVAAR